MFGYYLLAERELGIGEKRADVCKSHRAASRKDLPFSQHSIQNLPASHRADDHEGFAIFDNGLRQWSFQGVKEIFLTGVGVAFAPYIHELVLVKRKLACRAALGSDGLIHGLFPPIPE